MCRKLFAFFLLVLQAYGQIIDSKCGTTFTPLASHEYYVFGPQNFMVCPSVGTMQDAVVCIQRGGSSDEYTRTNTEGTFATVCVQRQSENNSLCSMSGEFDAVAIYTRAIDPRASGSVEVASNMNSRFTITFLYGPTLENLVPLQIESDISLNISGMVVLVNMIHGPVVQSVYRVCERQTNGSIVSADFVANVNFIADCAPALAGPATPASRASSISLHSTSPLTPEGVVTLFLTTSSECSESAFNSRITEPFNVTLINATTSSPSTPPPTTPTTSQPTLEPEIIAAICIAVLVVVVVVVAVFVLIVVAVCWRQRQKRRPVVRKDPASSSEESYTPLPNGNGHSGVIETSLIETSLPVSESGTEDTDSGVGSPGPSTPHINCVYYLCQDPSHPWYKEVVRILGVMFNLPMKELSLSEDEHDFELVFHNKLESAQCQHLLIFQTHEEDSKCSTTFQKFISRLESRGLKYPKVWVVVVGAQQESTIDTAVNRLCVTLSPGTNEATSEECARHIYRAISNSHQSSDAKKTSSLGPASFPQLSKEPSTASWPMPKRNSTHTSDTSTNTELLRELVNTNKRVAVAYERTANASERTANASERTAKAMENQGIANAELSNKMDNLVAMAEDDGIRRDQETINEQPSPPSEDTT